MLWQNTNNVEFFEKEKYEFEPLTLWDTEYILK